MKRDAFIRLCTGQAIVLLDTFLVKTSFLQDNHCTISDDERSSNGCRMSGKFKKFEIRPTRHLKQTEFQMSSIKFFGMTLCPFFSPLLTLPILKAFFPFKSEEDY